MTHEPGADARMATSWPNASVDRVAAEVPYRVRFDESGPDAAIRTSTLLRYAQDVAWIHSEALGFDRGWYAARGLAWVVRSAELRVRAQIRMGEMLRVRTQVVGFRKVWARRRTEVRRLAGAGEGDRTGADDLLAWVHTDWVMTGRGGAPARVPDDIPAVFGIPSEPYVPIRVELPPSPPAAVEHLFAVRPHEIDPMAHANNAAYVDWAEETATGLAWPDPGAPFARAIPRAARFEYLVPVTAGTTLTATAWIDETISVPDRPVEADAGPRARTAGLAVRITNPAGGEVLRATLSG